MWRNHEALELVEWLRAFNGEVAEPDRRASFYGLDLYSFFTPINAVVTYLSSVDPEMAGDEYDVDAITHVMACVSSFPGEFI